MNKKPATVGTSDEQIDAAIARTQQLPDEPVAVSAQYHCESDMIVVKLNTGRRLLLPREEMEGLESANEAQLSHIEIFAGLDIAWPELDVDHYLPHLLEGRYATEHWKQSRQKQNAAA